MIINHKIIIKPWENLIVGEAILSAYEITMIVLEALGLLVAIFDHLQK